MGLHWYERIDPVELLAYFTWSQAADESIVTQAAIMMALINRTAAPGFPKKLTDVVLAGQFNLIKLGTSAPWIGPHLPTLAQAAMWGMLVDRTGGAVHFVKTGAAAPAKSEFTVRLGQYDFYKSATPGATGSPATAD